MDQTHYKKMAGNLDLLIGERVLEGKRLYLFGHCSATEELADPLLENGFLVTAILDNNTAKQGRGIGILKFVRHRPSWRSRRGQRWSALQPEPVRL